MRGIIAVAIVILLNWLSGFVSLRFDLTEEKRFTLSDVTKSFLHESLEDDMQVTLYLDGSVNSGFSCLEKSTLSMLRQFRAQNKKHFSYDQINIDEVKSKDEKKALIEQLQKQGVVPINVIDEDNNGKRIQKSVYPWAMVSYKGRQYPVKLLLNVSNKSGEQNLNSSIENMEYQFTEVFRTLTDTAASRIAFLEGQGEIGEGETYDITTALSRYYSVDRGVIGDDPTILDAYKAVIVAGPTEKFTEKDKYVLDQYIMNGGKVMWLIDGLRMSMDSLTKAENNYAIYNDVNLSDMLFRYGVRINPNLLQDVQCALYPVNVAGEGEQARFQPLPWFYSPLLMPNPKHPISRYLSNIKGEFISTIDLVGDNANINKTVLLTSSANSRIMPVPVVIDLGMSVSNEDLKQFTAGQQPVALLLEGEFSSVFANRMKPRTLRKDHPQKDVSVPTKMIVISDGDVMRNGLRGYGEQMQIVPLGYDYATNKVLFDNKNFLLNAVNYLTDEKGWFTLRQRSIKLRLLDKRQMERRQFYRILNVALPLVLLMVLSIIFMLLRKRRYNKH